MSVEYTRENIVKSLRACAEGCNCTVCVYYDDKYKMEENGIDCEEELMRAAAAMLEEIGKGELPRKPVTVEKESLITRYYRAQGRAEVFYKAVGFTPCPPLDFAPSTDEEYEAEIAYFEAVSDAAIVVLEMRSKEGE